jgi:hypothetical protein
MSGRFIHSPPRLELVGEVALPRLRFDLPHKFQTCRHARRRVIQAGPVDESTRGGDPPADFPAWIMASKRKRSGAKSYALVACRLYVLAARSRAQAESTWWRQSWWTHHDGHAPGGVYWLLHGAHLPSRRDVLRADAVCLPARGEAPLLANLLLARECDTSYHRQRTWQNPQR